MQIKIDTNKLVNVAANAFVSAVFGGIGSYTVHVVTKNIAEKEAAKNKPQTTRRKIGFDLRG